MNTFLITFGVFLAVIAAMAVGYIFQKKVVKGSCGGGGVMEVIVVVLLFLLVTSMYGNIVYLR